MWYIFSPRDFNMMSYYYLLIWASWEQHDSCLIDVRLCIAYCICAVLNNCLLHVIVIYKYIFYQLQESNIMNIQWPQVSLSIYIYIYMCVCVSIYICVCMHITQHTNGKKVYYSKNKSNCNSVNFHEIVRWFSMYSRIMESF